MTPETAIFEGLETLLRLARDARAGGGEQDPVAVVGSAVGVFFWGATPVWSRAGTGKGRFEEGGDKACGVHQGMTANDPSFSAAPETPSTNPSAGRQQISRNRRNRG